jgi:DNA-binding CsgD family transcriptional regulator
VKKANAFTHINSKGMVTKKPLELGRESFRLRSWKDAYNHLYDADAEIPLSAEDLKLYAIAAHLTGKTSESNNIWLRAHSHYLNNGNIKHAVHCAFQLGFALFHQGEYARGGGWFARARTLLTDQPSDCAELGYLLLPIALQSLKEEDAACSLSTFEQAGQIGVRFKDNDLITLSLLGRGQALIMLKDIHAGISLLDEAMAAVDSGEVSPIYEGIIYCSVIESCLDIFDLKRAHEWTEALTEWCDAQPQLVPFRGECLVRRSEIMQMHGYWSKGIEEASRATEFLTKSISIPATGAAFYQLGEMHRLKGEFIKAEEAYRSAIQWGQIINPGLSLLRLEQGQIDIAKRSIEIALNEAKSLRNRFLLIPAYIEIMLTAGDIHAAEKAADELVNIANNLEVPIVKAWSAKSYGMILWHKGEYEESLAQLRSAYSIFTQLNVPYELARVRVLIGKSYQALEDSGRALMEYEAAKTTFHQLGAIPDIMLVDSLLKEKQSTRHGLSRREMEVLCQVALGITNKAIADELYISERTVERHVSNIFIKLDVSSRSAITAYAYRHNLI